MFSSKIEKLYYRSIHWSKSTFIIEISILEENIEIYIGDAFTNKFVACVILENFTRQDISCIVKI